MNKLFHPDNGYGVRRKRAPQRLFIPAFLRNEAEKHFLKPNEAYATAQNVINRWADLLSSGKLLRMTESALEAEFITQVFGEALGYVLFSEDRDHWELRPKFSLAGGQQADAAIGIFRPGSAKPRAMLELKGPTADFDRDRSNGRTPVEQLWNYLNASPDCPWGIVSNMVIFRLYHQDKTPFAYEEFFLGDLKADPRKFREFYTIFQRDGLLPIAGVQEPRADRLLDLTTNRQREVGADLYAHYHEQRVELIRHLMGSPHEKSLDGAVRIAQKLLNRVVFVAFCEDRDLLPPHSLKRAYRDLPPFTKVTNPRWRNFLELFKSIDEGNEALGIHPYDGELFRRDDEVDNLDLDDAHTAFFERIGGYDFSSEVNLDVLGHLFEQSIFEIDRIRSGELFGESARGQEAPAPRMGKSARRKRGGVYYTPAELTEFIVARTISPVIERRNRQVNRKHGIKQADLRVDEPSPQLGAYWRDRLEALRAVKVCDPACGSGAFLIQAYLVFEREYDAVVENAIFHEGPSAETLRDRIPEFILKDNLYGVDLSHEAVEITRLALWIRSCQPEKTLVNLSENVVCGNSLITDPEADPLAMRWEQTFPEVFDRDRGGFDCVIGNPPWERVKLQEREFFDTSAPKIASAVSAATRRKLITRLETGNPELYERYRLAGQEAQRNLDYCRKSGKYPLTGKGDINTYAVFAELAARIVATTGRVGLLVPSGIATDKTTKDFFASLIESERLAALYDFENKAPLFPDVHRSYKFCVFLFGGEEWRTESIDFVFFARRVEDLADDKRHVNLSPADLILLNPNTRTCPIFRSRRDAELTKDIYRRVPILIDRNRKKGGNPWGVKFVRMFDQTNDAELFHTAERLKQMRFRRDGAVWRKGRRRFLPLYEAKMVQAYDHRAAGVVVKDRNWMRQGQTEATTPTRHANPEFTVEPRWWVEENEILPKIDNQQKPCFLGFKDITSATNRRTMIAAFIPFAGLANSAPLIVTKGVTELLDACLLGNLNSLSLDFVARQKVGGVHLNFFIVEQLPVFPPAFYRRKCPWEPRRTLERWISDRVLKLTCTAEDMVPLAEAAGLGRRVHRWDEDERAELTAELDAAYFILYGLSRDDAEYVLSTFQGVSQAQGRLLTQASAEQRVLEAYDRLRGD